MTYLFDSDTLSDFYETTSPDHPGIIRRIASLGGEDTLSISILSLYEFEYGYANAAETKKPVLRQRIVNASTRFRVLGLSLEVGRLFGKLKKKLSDARRLTEKGRRYHTVDLIVAATAIAESYTLVSSDSLYGDLCELEPSLKLEDWRQA
ncbi:MAG TPA: type II toxin-antitoxin system VapC family toxin [Thermoanaerobaculia bacterium]|nr:type II toxin-antitoxin system VapC family toxin [Thermoanaerobaculia bacterium]